MLLTLHLPCLPVLDMVRCLVKREVLLPGNATTLYKLADMPAGPLHVTTRD
jgi:hypothetical protein